MSAMTIEQAEEMREGTLDLFQPGWFCTVHELKVKEGKECAFCVHDALGDEGFEKWARTQL